MSRSQVSLEETATLCSEGRRTEEEGEGEDERRVLERIGVRSLHAVVNLSSTSQPPFRYVSALGVTSNLPASSCQQRPQPL